MDGDFTIVQDWDGYTAAQHGVWRTLFHRQAETLVGRAAPEFLAGLSNRVLELGPDGPTPYGGGYREYVARSGHEAPGLR